MGSALCPLADRGPSIDERVLAERDLAHSRHEWGSRCATYSWVISKLVHQCPYLASISSTMGRTSSTALPAGSQLPVEVALAGVDGAGVTAAHGHDDVGRPGGLVGEGLGELLGDVEAPLGEDATTDGLSWSPGSEPADCDLDRPWA